ncbi:hypothetical protein ABK040_007788 [Willaertia magna]
MKQFKKSCSSFHKVSKRNYHQNNNNIININNSFQIPYQIQLNSIGKDNNLNFIHFQHGDSNNYFYSIHLPFLLKKEQDDNNILFPMLVYHHFNQLLYQFRKSNHFSPLFFSNLYSINELQTNQSLQFFTNNKENIKDLINKTNKNIFYPNWDKNEIELLLTDTLEGLIFLDYTNINVNFGRNLLFNLFNGNVKRFKDYYKEIINFNKIKSLKEYYIENIHTNKHLFILGNEKNEDMSDVINDCIEPYVFNNTNPINNNLEEDNDWNEPKEINNIGAFDQSLPNHLQNRIAIAYKLNGDIINNLYDYILLQILNKCLLDSYPKELGSFSVRPYALNGLNLSMNKFAFIFGIEGVEDKHINVVKNKLNNILQNIDLRKALHYLTELEIESQTLHNFRNNFVIEGANQIWYHPTKNFTNEDKIKYYSNILNIDNIFTILKQDFEKKNISTIFTDLFNKYFKNNNNKLIYQERGSEKYSPFKDIQINKNSNNNNKNITLEEDIIFEKERKEEEELKELNTEVSTSFISKNVSTFMDGSLLYNEQESNGDLVDISVVKFENIYFTMESNSVHDMMYLSIASKLIEELGARDASIEELDKLKDQYFPRGLSIEFVTLHDRYDLNKVKYGIHTRTQVLKKNVYKALDIIEAILNDSTLKEMNPHNLNSDLIKNIAMKLRESISSEMDPIELCKFSAEGKINGITRLREINKGWSAMGFMQNIIESKDITKQKEYIVKLFDKFTSNSEYKILITSSRKNKDAIVKVAKDFLASNPSNSTDISSKAKYSDLLTKIKERNRFVIAPEESWNDSLLICKSMNIPPITDPKSSIYFLLSRLINEKFGQVSNETQEIMKTSASFDGVFSIVASTLQNQRFFQLSFSEALKTLLDFELDDITNSEWEALKNLVLKDIGDTIVYPTHDRATMQLFYGVTNEDFCNFKKSLASATIEDIRATIEQLIGFEEQPHSLVLMGKANHLTPDIEIQSKGGDASWEISGGKDKASLDDFILGKEEEEKEKKEELVPEYRSSF